MNQPMCHSILLRALPIFAGLLCLSGFCRAGDNLVKNGDFSNGDLLPDDWIFFAGETKLWDAQQALEKVAYEQQGGVDDSKCLRVKPSEEKIVADQIELNEILEPGTYKLSAQIKSEGFNEGSLRLAVVNRPFTEWNGYIDIKPGAENDGSTGWTEIQTTFTQAEEQKGFRIDFLVNSANGTIWIDDIALEKVGD